jgi:hypothetical protein
MFHFNERPIKPLKKFLQLINEMIHKIKRGGDDFAHFKLLLFIKDETREPRRIQYIRRKVGLLSFVSFSSIYQFHRASPSLPHKRIVGKMLITLITNQ